MKVCRPIITFTFDDFPRSALHIGGEILRNHGFRGTYYVSFGLMGKSAPTGEIFHHDDIDPLLQTGHELGCHTFAHCPAAETCPDAFERSIIDNRQALQRFTPGGKFQTLSYPIGWPKPATKRLSGRHFLACREGGQGFNHEVLDLNRLKAFFLEKAAGKLESIQRMIDATCRANGWLIFATHDISERPTAYGCTPVLFERVVCAVAKSGANVQVMSTALRSVGVTSDCVSSAA